MLKKKTFSASRSTFTGDFKFTRRENPKSSNSITISMACTPTHHLHIIIASLYPTYLTQLLFREQQRHHSVTTILHWWNLFSSNSLCYLKTKTKSVKIKIKSKNKESNHPLAIYIRVCFCMCRCTHTYIYTQIITANAFAADIERESKRENDPDCKNGLPQQARISTESVQEIWCKKRWKGGALGLFIERRVSFSNS